jgi:heavy metal sensor kinase
VTLSIRARLTLWHALVFAATLAVTVGVGYGIVRRQIARATDEALLRTQRQLTAALTVEAEERGGTLDAESAAEVLLSHADPQRPVAILLHGTAMGAPVLRDVLARLEPGYSTRGTFRLLLAPLRAGRTPFVVCTAQALEPGERVLGELRHAMLLTAPLALLIAISGGYLLSRKSLAPVAAIAAKAREIEAANLGERIAVANPDDELGRLAATLNDLLARLDASFATQRRFMADASHELRTPLAVLQGELDVTLSRDDRNAADYRSSLDVMRRSVLRLSRIVRDLLLLARADAGRYPARIERLYLDEVIAQTARELQTAATERGVALTADCGGELPMYGDEDLLHRMVTNLAENAVRVTPAGGQVNLRCERRGAVLRIEVRDGGPGIPQDALEKVFERFFRVDAARTASDNSGLGLPIARWIAELHRGTLRLERSDDQGSTFAAELPAEAGSSSV